jgi:hypothetical protein
MSHVHNRAADIQNSVVNFGYADSFVRGFREGLNGAQLIQALVLKLNPML